jgi:hypothetical protein
MGLNVQSSVTRDNINSIANIVNQTITSVQSQAIQNSDVIQISDIILGGVQFCGAASSITNSSVTINQTGQINNRLDSNVYSNINITDLDTLKTNLDQEAKKSFDSDQGWLAIAASIQTSITDFQGTIINNIRNISQTDITNSCNQTSNIYNTGRLIICDDIQGSEIVVNQNGAVTALNQCVTTTILKQIFNTAELQDIAQKTDERFASQQEGLSTIFRWLIWAVVIIGVLIILGIILYLLFGGSKNAVKPEQLAGLVRPGVERCAMKAKAKLEAEGRAGNRTEEKFLIERCLSEERSERRFNERPESYEMRDRGYGNREFRERGSDDF